MKELNGAELAGFIKERQAHQVHQLQAQGVKPKLVILRDNDSSVIAKYVSLKKKYGEDIGIAVEDTILLTEKLAAKIEQSNRDPDTHGIIVQLPLEKPGQTDKIVQKIYSGKDVDDLTESHKFDGATATAINWLLTGYNVELKNRKIAVVGRGRLVGAPLIRMWRNSSYDVTVFGHDSDLNKLANFDVIVTATGQPHLITSDMIKPDAVIVDAGTASEDGVIVGDIDRAVRERNDLNAITPAKGGVGPLTIAALFENVLIATQA